MKKKLIIAAILSGLGFGVGCYLKYFYDCGYSISCYHLHTVSNAIYYGMGALAIIFLVLLFLPSAYPAWKKFAIWFIPLAALLFIFYPEPGAGDLFAPYPVQIYQWVSGLYLIISLLIIGFVSIRRTA
jgi:hypothetical protein